MFDINWQSVLDQLTYDPKNPMIFSTGVFLFLFLGFTLIYNLLGKNKTTTLRLLFVTLFSYYFYYKSSGYYFYLLLIVSLTDFILAYLIYRNNVRAGLMTEEQIRKRKLPVNRLLLGLSLCVDLGILVYFKYTNFFGNCWADITGGHWDMLDIILPVGVSFFTFQSLSYTFDTYRGKMKPLTNFLDYAFFVSFFPQLVAGPIVRAKDFIPQIRKPLFVSKPMFGRALFLIMAGLLKKAVIADYISVNFVDRVFEQPDLYSGVENLLGLYAYCIQLYCDFSGYSDMAIGIALMLGFTFPKNFDAPYKSQSVTEFWRRWHISLSFWLRDYVYISLGGNRHGLVRQCFNVGMVMVVGGFWHGAGFNFLLWGVFQGLMLVVEKLYMDWRKKRNPNYHLMNRKGGMTGLIRMLLTFHIFMFSLIYFRSTSFESGTMMLTQIFGNFSPQVFTQWVVGYWVVAVLVLLGFITHLLPSKVNDKVTAGITRMPLVGQALLLVIVIFIVIQMKTADVQPFIYFDF